MKNLHTRILDVLESLDELGAEAHGIASNGHCAQFQYWEDFDPTKQAAGNSNQSSEPECDCEFGALILLLSEETRRPTVRYRHPHSRFGSLPAEQRKMF